MRVVRLWLVVVAIWVVATCPIPARAADAQVEVGPNNEFRPKEVTIGQGDKVTWRFTGTSPHSVTADDRSFDSHPNCSNSNIAGCSNAASAPFERTFQDAGTFRYFCKIHGGEGGARMSGTVVVTSAQAPASPTTSPPPPPPPAEPDPTTTTTAGRGATTTAVGAVTTTTAASATAPTAVPDTIAEAPAADPALEPTTTIHGSPATTEATGETAAAAGNGSGNGVWPAALLALACLAGVIGGLVRFRPR